VNEVLDRAVGELASENADLYKLIDALKSEMKADQAKFRAWAKEIAVRDEAREASDEARDKREEALTNRIAELERRPAEKPAADPGGPKPGLTSRSRPAGRPRSGTRSGCGARTRLLPSTSPAAGCC
jgi:hypothetical protein